MSIIIKGMDMPKSCGSCMFMVSGTNSWFYICLLNRELGKPCEIIYTDGLPCPLVELPPHGDLIDRDAMIEESRNGKYMWAYDLTDLPEFSKDLPVVIPAERSVSDA